ncbi:Diphthine--ammonia ligase [Lachnellula hyalina]|uniref:Diphthine--ammonia ligase n=1 Tax=Lachnellula hyalina TaxID=1316788 RepID=A0A8H8TWD8_9HELO|nr:Diphthine--ammonia ligase [Lachnellula hyalina]TVY24297.1 Diphthine--ammonia ligase [Lachnellula hyalina]
MTESLNVIALISGGKDSFFSILHCLQNGHKVVALGNLYPASGSGSGRGEVSGEADSDDEHDLNSFMYQTVGHTVIPLYEQALQIPLYRQPIVGTAVQTAVSYSPVGTLANSATANSEPELGELDHSEDETESLVPLLKSIIAKHPTANAISTGAILSTYQRTRVESVALRLGLTPLGFLWKYPTLPPGSQLSLLEDMESVGLDARLIKVASGGLDESFLWQNVASAPVMRRVERSVKRFGTDGDGAVIGEGGEFETMVIDGPRNLFKGRIEIQEQDRRIVREGGGAAWLRILKAKVVMKTAGETTEEGCRIPGLLSPKFSNVLKVLKSGLEGAGTRIPVGSTKTTTISNAQPHIVSPTLKEQESLIHWTPTSTETLQGLSVIEEAASLVSEIRQHLKTSSLQPSDIVSTVIILRSMADFAAVNKIYGTLFTTPNPPARVTISSGSLIPPSTHLTIHLTLHRPSPQEPARKALHVQSRSYWAPANIGPYSQAISIPSPNSNSNSTIWTVSVAGQIPLIPHTMALPPSTDTNTSSFALQAVLSLQHLWRIGTEMHVSWWTSAVAFLPRASDSQRAVLASRAWELLHERAGSDEDEDEEEDRDLWVEKHFAGMERRGEEDAKRELPDWEMVKGAVEGAPPFWAVEVEELPRGAAVEWHAHLGVVGGFIQIYPIIRDEGCTIHQCGFGGRLRSVLMVDYSSSSSDVRESLSKGLGALGLNSASDIEEYASCLDVSIDGLQSSRRFSGAIPCRSIWDSSGDRLALVLLFDS